MTRRLEVFSPDGIGEVRPGDDLAAVVLAALTEPLADGDVLVVTSKVVSKAEGRVRAGEREEAIAEETARVVARRGATAIVRTRLGLTMAAAGVDASNTTPGTVVLLPLDPDASARGLRERVLAATGRNVGVVVTDTAGRAWRHGQTDLAVGAAGIVVAEDFGGRTDPYGNPLAVTLTAVADELASTAELAQGKLAGRPVSVVRGRADLVLPAGEHGPGARALVREEGSDLFGYGAREAVVRALVGDPTDRAPFGAAVEAEELGEVVARVAPGARLASTDDASGAATLEVPGAARAEAARAVVFAHGWAWEETSLTPEGGIRARIRPVGT